MLNDLIQGLYTYKNAAGEYICRDGVWEKVKSTKDDRHMVENDEELIDEAAEKSENLHLYLLA